VTRATNRRVWLDATEYAVDVADEGSAHVGDASLAPEGAEAALTVRYRGTGEGGNDMIALRSAWKPGEPVWSGSVNGKLVAVQARPIPNGYPRGAARMRARRSIPSARPATPG
jgi:propionyl-CoA carboxylase alpha chain